LLQPECLCHLGLKPKPGLPLKMQLVLLIDEWI
jgi:hypothetical protein